MEKVFNKMSSNPFRKTDSDYREEENEILKAQLLAVFGLVIGCPAIMLLLVIIIRLLQGLPPIPPDWK